MRLTRHFFISDDIDDLERLEEELEREGVVTPQIHVLTNDDTAAAQHNHLHQVVSLMKKDVVHSTLIGAGVGVVAAILSLLVAYAAGWSETRAGWIPFIFLAIVLLGFFTWEGGLRGIEEPNHHFRKFEKALEDGNHVFFVDLEPHQNRAVAQVLKRHKGIHFAGKARGSPHWLVTAQYRVKRFFVETFP